VCIGGWIRGESEPERLYLRKPEFAERGPSLGG